MAFKTITAAPFNVGAYLNANTLNTAIQAAISAAQYNTHDPYDPTNGYGNSIPAWGSSNPLYSSHGPGGTGSDWGTAYNGKAAIPADPVETAINPANNATLSQGTTGNFTAAWGIHGEIARLRGALALLKGAGKNWYDPVSVATLDGSGNLALSSTATATASQYIVNSTTPGAAPFSLPSTATGKVTYLNSDSVDGFGATATYGSGSNALLLALNANGRYDQAAVDKDGVEAYTWDDLTQSGTTLTNNLNRIRHALSQWAAAAGLSSTWSAAPSGVVTGFASPGGTYLSGLVTIAGGAGVSASQNGNQIVLAVTGTIPPSSGAVNYSDILSDMVVSGLQVGSPSGLNVTVPTGQAYVAGSRATLGSSVVLALPSASGTYYIDWMGGQGTGAFSVNQNATVSGGYLRLASAVVSGGAVTGVTDLRVMISHVALLNAAGKLPLASLDGTGASNGQVPVWNGTSYVPGTVSGGGGFADPETTAGDMIYRNALNTTSRFAVGAQGTYIRATNGGSGAVLPAYATSPFIDVKADFGAKGDGITDDGPAIRAALNAAMSSGVRRVYFPSGVYYIASSNFSWTQNTNTPLVQITADNVEIYGDGMGKTFLTCANNVNAGASNGTNYTLWFSGCKNPCVHDLSINMGTGWTGTAGASNCGVEMDYAYRGWIYRVEVTNAWGLNTAGGTGIGASGALGNDNVNGLMFTTTLATAITSTGSQTVTPGSMADIYVGQRIYAEQGGANAEWVTVTATTATTFTANFTKTHAAPVSLHIWANFVGMHTIEKCYIHDCYQACGIGLNTSGCIIKGNDIVNVGSNGTQHGIYEQGGFNVVEDNYIEGASGYSIHGHKAATAIDGSGARYVHNTIVNPGNTAIIVDSINSDGTNPDVPSGIPMTRYAVIADNTIKGRVGCNATYGIYTNGVPAVIERNTVEDCGSNGMIGAGGTQQDSIIADNILMTINTSYTGVFTNGSHCSVKGNKFGSSTAPFKGVCMSTGDHTNIQGNIIYATGPVFHGTNSNTDISGNEIYCPSTATGYVLDNPTAGAVGIKLHDNLIDYRGSGYILWIDGNQPAGIEVYDNDVPNGALTWEVTVATGASMADVHFRNNRALMGPRGYSSTKPARGNARLTYWRKDAVSIADAGLALKRNAAASNNLTNCATTDTQCDAISVAAHPNAGTAEFWVIAEAGQECWVQTDALVTQGHFGVLSTTSAGKWKDNGTAIPASPASYIMFQETTTGAGWARAKVMRIGAD